MRESANQPIEDIYQCNTYAVLGDRYQGSAYAVLGDVYCGNTYAVLGDVYPGDAYTVLVDLYQGNTCSVLGDVYRGDAYTVLGEWASQPTVDLYQGHRIYSIGRYLPLGDAYDHPERLLTHLPLISCQFDWTAARNNLLT